MVLEEDDDVKTKLAFIRSISLTPSGILYSIKEPEMTNKVLRKYFSK